MKRNGNHCNKIHDINVCVVHFNEEKKIKKKTTTKQIRSETKNRIKGTQRLNILFDMQHVYSVFLYYFICIFFFFLLSRNISGDTKECICYIIYKYLHLISEVPYRIRVYVFRLRESS